MKAIVSSPRDRKSMLLGYAAALAVVLVTAAYPALTRSSVTTTLTPADILLFRLGASGLLFVPYLVLHAHEIRRCEWLAALPLSFLHGWGMAGCVVFGLQYAPASHAAALGPGAIAAWIALIGFVAYRIEVDSKRLAGIAVIVGGVALILAASYRGHSLATAVIGDAMFLAASALGATYLVYIQRRRLDPVLAAALVCVASAMVVAPWHYFFAASAIASARPEELAWQIVFQGVVFGCGVAFAINYAVLAVGSQTVGVLSALVPVLGALCALWIADDRVSGLEWIAIAAISSGVAMACLPARGVLPLLFRGGERRRPRSAGSPSAASTAARMIPGSD
ncbi:MAG TPA: DMT family transporter [Casimicrobiaceae bacterium]|nr:DMT family transporter [Casimicrobiaceae bacterium]